MKRLILTRHAKSSWSDSELIDRDRPLNARGRDAADRIGRKLAENGETPGQVLSSPAQRCRETWEVMSAHLPEVARVDFIERLYLAEPGEMLGVLQGAEADTVLMLGHMPGIGLLARRLRRDPPPRHESFEKYPTGATTILDFATDSWAGLLPGTGKLVDWITPRDL